MSEQACGIPIPDWVSDRWPGWFAPGQLPFVVDALSDAERAALPEPTTRDVPMELVDTFWIHGADRARLWLGHAEFDALPTQLRRRLLRAQRDQHEAWQRGPEGRFGPWWPDLLGSDLAPVVEFVERDCVPSRHREVTAATWAAAAVILPDAREIAGTFAPGSGPNCFGTVMGAAGVDGAASEWMQREAFEDWLACHTVPAAGAGRDREPGVVFVRRDDAGMVQHACVTLGDGWVLNKPSQGWMSPRFVWTVEQAKRHTREVGWHLYRHRLLRDRGE